MSKCYQRLFEEEFELIIDAKAKIASANYNCNTNRNVGVRNSINGTNEYLY